MKYTGERVQIDVKYVTAKSLTKEVKEKERRYYQYTAIDEYTRQRVLWASKEHSTYACLLYTSTQQMIQTLILLQRTLTITP